MANALENTILAEHEAGNPYCPLCDRMELVFPIPCQCGGLIHRHGDTDEEGADRYVEVCDACGQSGGAEQLF